MLENIFDILNVNSRPPVFYESTSVSNILFLLDRTEAALELLCFPKNFLNFSLINTGYYLLFVVEWSLGPTFTALREIVRGDVKLFVDL